MIPKDSQGEREGNEDPASASEAVSAGLNFLRKGTWLTAGGMVAGNISPVLVIFLARAFRPDVFGVYVSMQLLVLTLSKVTSLGLDRGLPWYVAAHGTKQPRCADALWLATVSSVGISLLLVLVVILATVWAGSETSSWTLGGPHRALAAGCFLSLPGWSLLHVHAGALEGARQPAYRIYVNQGLVMALAPASALVLFALGAGSWALPAGLFLATSVGVVILLRRSRTIFAWPEHWSRLRPDATLFRYCWPLGISELVSGARNRADIWFVLALAGPLRAGVYAVMTTLPAGVRSIRQSYDPMVLAVLSAMRPRDHDRLREVFSYAVHRVSSLQLVMATAVALFPEELLSLAGREYVLEPRALSLLLLGHLVWGSLGLTSNVVLGLGRSAALLNVNVAALLVGAGLNWLLIPRLGLVGAGLASAATAALMSLAALGLQLQLTKRWVFAAHLWSNTLLLLLVVIGITFQSELLAWGWLWRGALAALVAALISLNLLWKRPPRPVGPEPV